MSDTVEYGHPDTPASRWRTRRWEVLAAAEAVSVFVLTPLQTNSSGPATLAAVHHPRPTKSEHTITYQPGNKTLELTPFGNFLSVPKQSGGIRYAEVSQVRVTIKDAHFTKQCQLFGKILVDRGQETDIVPETKLPINSLTEDCVFESILGQPPSTPHTTELSITGSEPYTLVVHFRDDNNSSVIAS